MGVESSQSGHHHHTVQQKTGMLEHACAKHDVYKVPCLIRMRRAFSIVGPSTWNGLPLEIRLPPKDNESAFYRLLKTDLYHRGWVGGASE